MKEEVPDDAILMFRMGDFFELFFDDAILAAQELGLTLTSRDKDRGEDYEDNEGNKCHQTKESQSARYRRFY